MDPSAANTFSVGEYVLAAYPNRPPNKLSSIYRGPMIVEAKLRDDLFNVMDLVSNKVYQMHIDRLRKLNVANGISRQQLVDLAIADQHEFVVESILDHRGDPRRKSSLEFLVHWAGYSSEEDTWEPWKNVRDVAAMDVYSEKHPELRLG